MRISSQRRRGSVARWLIAWSVRTVVSMSSGSNWLSSLAVGRETYSSRLQYRRLALCHQVDLRVTANQPLGLWDGSSVATAKITIAQLLLRDP